MSTLRECEFCGSPLYLDQAIFFIDIDAWACKDCSSRIQTSLGNCQNEVATSMDRIAQVQHSLDMPNIKSCNHEYEHYIGFTEQFTYCVKCDERK